MREEILRELEADYAEKRARNEREESRRREEIRAKEPGIGELMSRREGLIFDTLRGILQENTPETDLASEMEQLNGRIRQGLKAAGYPENYLSPIWECKICRDTGYVGDPLKEPCSCLTRAYQAKVRRDIGLGGDRPETFETFDLSVFPEEKEAGARLSQRERMNRIRKLCEDWANEYPGNMYRDVMLTGKSGLGKTFLLRAMAARLIERDIPVLLISAYRFLEIARKSYFENDGGLEELLTVPVLMLDDVGSEPLMQNVTVEQMFNLINERQNRGLSTLISTNLNLIEFRNKYTERIASRMTDPLTCLVLPLEGRDIRERED